MSRVLADDGSVRTCEAFDAAGRRALLVELAPRETGEALLDALEALKTRLFRSAHPSAPPWLELFATDEGQRIYAVQALPDARELDEALPRRALPVRRGLALARQLFEALAALHGGLPRLVHGDVRPSRILVGPGDSLSLTGSGVLEAFARAEPEMALWEARDGSRDLRGAGAVLFRLADRFGRAPDEVADVAAALAESPWDADARRLVARLLELPGAQPFRRASEAGEAVAALLARPEKPSSLRKALETLLAALLLLRRGTRWLRYLGLAILGLTPGYLAGAGLLPWGKHAPASEAPPPRSAPEKPSGPENPWEAGGWRALAPVADGALVAVAFASPGCAPCDASITTLEELTKLRAEPWQVVTLAAFDPSRPDELAWARALRAAGKAGRREGFAAFAGGRVPSEEESFDWARAQGLDLQAFADRHGDPGLLREARRAGARVLAEPLVYVDGTRVEGDRASLAEALEKASRRVRK